MLFSVAFGVLGGVAGGVTGVVLRSVRIELFLDFDTGRRVSIMPVLASVLFGALSAWYGWETSPGDIKPVDELEIDLRPRAVWRALGTYKKVAALAGLVFGAVVGVVVGVQVGVAFGVVAGVEVVVGVSMMGLVRSRESKSRRGPNDGIRRSAINAARVGLPLSVLFGVLFGVLIGVLGDAVKSDSLLGEPDVVPISVVIGVVASLLVGMVFGMMSGVLFGMEYGGEAVIKHYLLRLLLALSGSLPLHLTPFLDAMSKRILLQRIGASYSFVHPTLQEHIAGLTDDRIEALAGR